MTVLLRIRGVRKAFGPVKALVGVDMDVNEGEVHGLIGENGAGKSTLMKILSGAHRPDSGEITISGSPYSITDPAQAREAGIAMIYQELTLAPHMSVEENMMLGRESSRCGIIRHQRKKAAEVLKWMGHGQLNPDTPAGRLPISLQQVVEIGRALASDARLIIMDEPTSSLTAEDTQALFRIIQRLKERNVAVIYISHFLEEVQRICDRFTVLRDGATVASGKVSETSIGSLIESMVGRSIEDMYPRTAHKILGEALQVEGLCGRQSPKNISLKVKRGEILGIAGLVGAGRSETLRCIFGLDRATSGTIRTADGSTLKAVSISPKRAMHAGLDMLSENRKEEGLATSLPITANITLSGLERYARSGLLSLKRERAASIDWCRKLNVKCRDAADRVSSLSGGNQQKVAIARLLHQDCDVLLLDEPTRGIDVGSKAEIYRLIQELAAQGKAIVVVSSYLPELLGICDSLAVMHRGTMSPVRPVSEWTEQQVMLFAASGRMEKETANA